MTTVDEDTENFCAYLPYDQPLNYTEVRLFECHHSDEVDIKYKAIMIIPSMERQPVILGNGIKVEKYDINRQPLHFANIEVYGYYSV